jgi:hypothetical protein
MNSRANGRLALRIAAATAFAALTANPLYACDATKTCPSNASNLDGVAANALPTYTEPAAEEPAAEPVKLQKFTRSQARTARRTPPRKATLAQRAGGHKSASRKANETEQDEREPPAQSKAEKPITPAMANANAQFIVPVAAKTAPAETAEPAKPAAAETQVTPAEPPAVELVSAEEFNDLDRAAWEANQMPKLMKLTASDSRAELRDDDSRWAQTSTIGKLFVAFGALLTIGSAVRMFLA